VTAILSEYALTQDARKTKKRAASMQARTVPVTELKDLVWQEVRYEPLMKVS